MKKEFLDMTEAERDERHRDYLHRRLIKAVKDIHKQKIYRELKRIKGTLIKNHDSCEICGYSYKPILQAHHILPVKNGGDNASDNLICVCPNCHKIIHTFYGIVRANKTQELSQLILFVLNEYGVDAYQALCNVIDRYFEKKQRTTESVWEKLRNEYL